MGKYIFLSIVLILVLVFLYGKRFFECKKISSNIRYSILFTASLVFLYTSFTCLHEAITTPINDPYNKYGILAYGITLLLLTTVVIAKDSKRIHENTKGKKEKHINYNKEIIEVKSFFMGFSLRMIYIFVFNYLVVVPRINFVLRTVLLQVPSPCIFLMSNLTTCLAISSIGCSTLVILLLLHCLKVPS